MSLKKKAVSLLLTGTLAGTVLAPTAFASDYEGYLEFLGFPQAASGYALVRENYYSTEDENASPYLASYCIYETDAKGCVLKKTEYPDRYEPDYYQESIYQYNSSGQRTTIIHNIMQDGMLSPNGIAYLTYDKNGDAVKEEFKIFDDVTIFKYEYDSHHNMIKQISEGETMAKYRYEYDKNGNMISEQSAWGDEDFKNSENCTFYEYDSNNRLIKEYYDNSKDSPRIYEYDSVGNLTKKSLYWNGKLDGYIIYEYKPLDNTVMPHVGQFTDVLTSSYYADAVKWAVDQGITTGTSSTAFSPDNSCTRGQIMQMLWRAAGSPEPSGTSNPFADVKSNDYFYKAVLWAVQKGITSGTSAATFSPTQNCTRAQIVTFIYKSMA